ncbi:hypothetical protein [Streptomyces sp. NRRL F-5630]|uniref:hypothetical protein n=1 Tax=Streptomyces sp. NRRL F-5630 TaxID=1463864 RepID=UPI003D72D834
MIQWWIGTSPPGMEPLRITGADIAKRVGMTPDAVGKINRALRRRRILIERGRVGSYRFYRISPYIAFHGSGVEQREAITLCNPPDIRQGRLHGSAGGTVSDHNQTAFHVLTRSAGLTANQRVVLMLYATHKTDRYLPPTSGSFTYDAAGNRTEQTDHESGATTTYTQSEPGKALPHAVQTTSVKGGADDGRKDTFGYDKAGNTTTRELGTRSQSLAWTTNST